MAEGPIRLDRHLLTIQFQRKHPCHFILDDASAVTAGLPPIVAPRAGVSMTTAGPVPSTRISTCSLTVLSSAETIANVN